MKYLVFLCIAGVLAGCTRPIDELAQRKIELDIDGDNVADQVVREVLKNGRRLLNITETTGSRDSQQFLRFDHFADNRVIFSVVVYSDSEKPSELVFFDPSGGSEVYGAFSKSKHDDYYKPIVGADLENLNQKFRSIDKYAEAIGSQKMTPIEE